MENNVSNAYEDEQNLIDKVSNLEIELMLRISELLDDHGYYISAEMCNDMPVLKLRKKL